jgi:CheY-like chemotaxis protein
MASTLNAASSRGGDVLQSDGAPPLVLVVDDEDATRTDVRDLLREEGYAVVEARDGREALDFLVWNRSRTPDCILLDLSMPIMTGWELLSIIKAYVRLSDIPVVLVSGVAPQLDPVKHGVIAAYLKKPYDAERLLQAVLRAIGAGGLSRAP